MNPSFGKPAIISFEPYIQALVDKFITRLKEWQATGKPVNLTDGFLCYAGDIVGEFCFGYDRNFLSEPNFNVPLLRGLEQLMSFTHILIEFPFLAKAVNWFPDKLLTESVLNVMNFKRGIRAKMEGMLTGKHDGREPSWVTDVLNNQDLPVHEKSLNRLHDEAIALSGAGETTAKGILTIAMFHLLQQPETWKQLKDEILTIFPDVSKPPSLLQLETLPLLTSTINEGMSSSNVHKSSSS